MGTVVAAGTWLYDGSVPTEVRVVRLGYDFWFAVGEADGELADRELPALNPDGYLYYVSFRPGSVEDGKFWPDSIGDQTLAEAKATAQRRLPGPVTWH